MFGFQSKTEAAKEILAFTATATPAAKAKIMDALALGASPRRVARTIREMQTAAVTCSECDITGMHLTSCRRWVPNAR